jgi:hypothetical protein
MQNILETAYFINDQMKQVAQDGGGTTLRMTPRQNSQKQNIMKAFRKAGWKQSVLDKRFRNLTDSMLSSNITSESLIKGFSYIWHEEQGFDTSIAKTLVNLGISSSIAKYADTAISPLQNTCYTNAQLIQIAIQYILGRFKPMTTPDTSHFHNPTILEKWTKYRNLPILNITESCSISLVPKLESYLEPISKPNYTWFFHTTSWENCIRIATKLDHTKGLECLDFGITPSFYMSNKIIHALKWGEHIRKKYTNEIATVLFAIPNTLPSHLRYKELKGDEWKSAVVKSRRCVRLEPHEINIPEIAPFDLVFGDMLANPEDIDTKSPRTHKPSKKQLASKSYEADRFLQECIVGVFVFNKQIS